MWIILSSIIIIPFISSSVSILIHTSIIVSVRTHCGGDVRSNGSNPVYSEREGHARNERVEARKQKIQIEIELYTKCLEFIYMEYLLYTRLLSTRHKSTHKSECVSACADDGSTLVLAYAKHRWRWLWWWNIDRRNLHGAGKSNNRQRHTFRCNSAVTLRAHTHRAWKTNIHHRLKWWIKTLAWIFRTSFRSIEVSDALLFFLRRIRFPHSVYVNVITFIGFALQWTKKALECDEGETVLVFNVANRNG